MARIPLFRKPTQIDQIFQKKKKIVYKIKANILFKILKLSLINSKVGINCIRSTNPPPQPKVGILIGLII